jgi:hypothetical protein
MLRPLNHQGMNFWNPVEKRFDRSQAWSGRCEEGRNLRVHRKRSTVLLMSI